MICRTNSQRLRRKGSVAVVVAICLVPLIGVMAFAIDGGLILAAKRRAQTAADAAAHAAACQLYSKLSYDPSGLDLNGSAKAAVFSNVLANGFNNEGSTNKVTVNIPPTNLSKSFQSKPGYAEVIIVYYQPRYFASIFGSGTIPITAQAVARGTVTRATNDSVVVLDSSSPAALSISNGAKVTTSGNIQVNSSNATAAVFSNGSQINAPEVDIVGNYSSGSSKVSGPVRTAAQAVPNPLGSIAPPDPSTLPNQPSSPTTPSLSPGVYNGGLSITNGMKVSLQPGIYYMKNGDFSIGNGASVIGDGVVIYMDNGGGKFNVANGAQVTLSPPTSGPYTGLVYFQDPKSSVPITLGNGVKIGMTGTVYAAGAAINIGNGAKVDAFGSQIISKSLYVDNGVKFGIDSSPGQPVASTRSLTLVQ